MKVNCTAIKELYRKESFMIYAFRPLGETTIELSNYGTFSMKGDLGWVRLNETYELDIEFVSRNKYGVEYKLNSLPDLDLDNLTDETEYDYLCQITTPRQAEYVNTAYPNFIRLVLDGKQDEIDVKKIYNIKEVRKNFLIREIEQKFKFYAIKKQFEMFDLSIGECKELNKQFKSVEEITNALENAPYNTLIEVCGRSFESADRIILEVFPNLRESFQRTEHLILDVLDSNEIDGSTFMNAREMSYYAKQKASECLKNMKQVAIDSYLIYYDEKTNNIARMNTYLGECLIASFVKEKLNNSTKLEIDWSKYTNVDGFELTEQQGKLLENLCNHSFSLLVGYGGTGKSASIKALVSLLEDNSMTYTLLAPTGRASARLKECTGRKTSTMHRAVSGDNLITTDVIVVDEFSFFGVEWTTMLLNGIANKNARIVFVGDPAQLNPIQCGKTFADMIDSGKVPMAMLTKVFRYADGGTMKVCTDIRNGEKYLSDEKLQKFGKDFKFIASEDPLETLVNEYTSLLDKGVKQEDILCLSPFNVGDAGCLRINSTIQSIVNPAKPNQITHSIKTRGVQVFFRKGDLVMNTKNDYKALPLESWNMLQENEELCEDDVPLTVVYNGDCGRIRSCDEKKAVVQFGEELVVYEKYKLQQLLLGYSISTHKCVTKDTTIYTNNGIKKISDLNNGATDGELREFFEDIEVYNGTNLERPRCFYNAGKTNVKKIKLEKGYEITSSLDHGFETIDSNGEFKRVNSKELKVGETLLLKIGGNIYGDKKDISYLFKDLPKMGGKAISYNVPNELDEDFSLFLGLMVADGTIHKDGIRLGKRHKDVVEKFKELVGKIFGYKKGEIKHTIDKKSGKNGMYFYDVGSKHIRNICMSIEGIKPCNKFVPSFMLETNKSNQCAFLKGVFEDGTVNVKNTFDHVELSMEGDIINQIKDMLINIGVFATYSKKDNLNKLYIYRSGIEEFAKNIGFVSEFKNSRLPHNFSSNSCKTYVKNLKKVIEKIIKEKSPSLSGSVKAAIKSNKITREMLKRFLKETNNLEHEELDKLRKINDGIYFLEIIEIEEGIENTYCLEMPITHKFVQNGILGYNCQGSQAPYVLNISSDLHSRMLTKELLYVACSRSSKQHVEIGSIKAINDGIGICESKSRNTFLKNLLIEQG